MQRTKSEAALTPHSGDVALERVLARALQDSQVDVTRITLQVRGSVALLRGFLAKPEDRLELVEYVMAKGMTQVIDAMTLPGETSDVQIYFGRGGRDLRDAIADAYDVRSTWDGRRASGPAADDRSIARPAPPSGMRGVRSRVRSAMQGLKSLFRR